MSIETIKNIYPAKQNAVKVECCKYCGSVELCYKYKRFSTGMVHIECRCSDCDKFQQWAKQVIDVNKVN